MILIKLFFEFFKAGLFAVGGGMATIPFLMDMADTTDWFTRAQLADMVAVSESTPGPIGVNMSTYVGYTTAGIPGGLIGAAGVGVASMALLNAGVTLADGIGALVNWKAVILAIVVLIFSNWVKPTKKWHPIVFIAISAVVGVVFRFGGV